MNYFTDITGYRAAGDGVDLLVHLPQDIRYLIKRQNIRHAEVILDDGRHISIEQRKKIYATLRDISDYTGDPPEVTKEWMKYCYIEKTGCQYFSLSGCSAQRNYPNGERPEAYGRYRCIFNPVHPV